MPIYEFECRLGTGRGEILLPLRLKKLKYMMCPICFDYHIWDFDTLLEIDLQDSSYGHFADKVISIPSPPYIASSTRVFTDMRTGERFVATSKYEKPPYGCVVEELKGTRERSRFEKQETEKANVIASIQSARTRERTERLSKERHDETLRTLDNKQIDYDEHGNKVEYHYDNKTKEMLKAAIRRPKKRKVPEKIVERRLAVNHMNESNMIDSPQ